MKVKSLFLIGAASVLLSGCGAKGYKNEVKVANFSEKYLAALGTKAYYKATAPFSYEISNESSTKSLDQFLKNGKVIAEEKLNSNGKGNGKFDSLHSVIYMNSTYNSVRENPDVKVVTDNNADVVVQTDNKNAYEIDKRTKSYVKVATESPESYVASYAVEHMGGSIVGAFLMNLEMYENPKVYIDNNLYTIVGKQIEEDVSKSKYKNDIYQIELRDNGFEYYSHTKLEIKEANLKTVDETETRIKVTTKSINLNTISLEEYLQVSNLPNLIN